MSEQNQQVQDDQEVHEITASDYQSLYQEQKEENERLKAVIAAARIQSTPGAVDRSERGYKPAVTANRLVGMLGRHQVNQLSRSEQCMSLGIADDPGDEFLRKCFGRASSGNDGSALRELQRTSPKRAAELRELAILRNIYGA